MSAAAWFVLGVLVGVVAGVIVLSLMRAAAREEPRLAACRANNEGEERKC